MQPPLETITFPLFPFSLFLFSFFLIFSTTFPFNLILFQFLTALFPILLSSSFSSIFVSLSNAAVFCQSCITPSDHDDTANICPPTPRNGSLPFATFRRCFVRKITCRKKLKFVRIEWKERRETRGKDSMLFKNFSILLFTYFEIYISSLFIEQLLPTKFPRILYKSHFFLFLSQNCTKLSPTFSLNELLHNRKITQSRFEKPADFVELGRIWENRFNATLDPLELTQPQKSINEHQRRRIEIISTRRAVVIRVGRWSGWTWPTVSSGRWY